MFGSSFGLVLGIFLCLVVIVICWLYFARKSLSLLLDELRNGERILECWGDHGAGASGTAMRRNSMLPLFYYDEDGIITDIRPLAFSINIDTVLAKLRANYRVALEYVPSILTALGIGFTFVGLIIALLGGNFLGEDSSAVRESINQVLGGVAPAFFSSLIGISGSVVALVLSRIWLAEVSQVCERIRGHAMHRRVPESPEQILHNISLQNAEQLEVFRTIQHHVENSDAKMQVLASDISTTLENNIANPMRESIEELSNRINSAVTNNLDHYTHALKETFDSFGEKFTSSTNQHFAQLETALKGAIEWHEKTREALDETWVNLNNHVDEYRLLLEQQNETFKAQEEFEADKNEKFVSATELIDGLVSRFEESLDAFNRQQQDSSELMEALTTVNERLEAQIETLLTTDAQFSQAVDDAKAAFVHEIKNVVSAINESVSQFTYEASSAFGGLGESFNELLTTHGRAIAEANNTLSQRIHELLETDSKFAQSIHDLRDDVADELEELSGTITTDLQGFHKQIEQTLKRTAASYEQMIKNYQESVNTLPRHDQILRNVRSELDTGLQQTFKMFDHETSEIAKHLAGTNLDIKEGLDELNKAIALLSTLVKEGMEHKPTITTLPAQPPQPPIKESYPIHSNNEA